MNPDDLVALELTARVPAVASPAVINRSQPVTILLIDDEAPVRDVTVRILTRRGYTMLQAASGNEGAALVAAHASQINLVLLDWAMAGLHGCDLIVLLRTLRADLPIIVISGYSESEIASQVPPGSVAAFVYKPFHADQIDALIREVLA